jgi:hypothetical protein
VLLLSRPTHVRGLAVQHSEHASHGQPAITLLPERFAVPTEVRSRFFLLNAAHLKILVDYCPEGQYCTDNGCCPEGTTLAECGATVSLSVIPPSADTTSVPVAASSSVAAATTTTTSPSTSSTPAANTSTSSTASPTASPKSTPTQKSSPTPVVTPTPSANTTLTNPASTPTTSAVQAGGAGQAFGVDVFHLALGWVGAIFLAL